MRPGSGGKRRYPGLLVSRSSTLEGQVTRKDGLPVVVAERALVDLALPAVNIKLNGPRPDFTWRRHRLIIEIDG